MHYAFVVAFRDALAGSGMQVEVFPSDALGSEKERIGQTAQGLVQVNLAAATSPASISPMLRGLIMPFMFRSAEEFDAVIAKTDLLERMNANGVPCAPLYSYSQVLADPQVQHMQWVEDITLPNGVASKTVISPQRVSGQRLGVRQAPPALGAHTQQVIAELKTASTKAAT